MTDGLVSNDLEIIRATLLISYEMVCAAEPESCHHLPVFDLLARADCICQYNHQFESIVYALFSWLSYAWEGGHWDLCKKHIISLLGWIDKGDGVAGGEA